MVEPLAENGNYGGSIRQHGLRYSVPQKYPEEKIKNPPIGLILCAEHDDAVAHYALGGLSHNVFASRYKLRLPAPQILRREIEAERRRLEQRLRVKG